jgi:hypothetical protein
MLLAQGAKITQPASRTFSKMLGSLICMKMNGLQVIQQTRNRLLKRRNLILQALHMASDYIVLLRDLRGTDGTLSAVGQENKEN